MIKRVNCINGITDAEFERIGKLFVAEAKLPGEFCTAHFRKWWDTALRMGVGAFWVMTIGDKIYGLIGGLLSQCPFTGETLAVETFWFVEKEMRSTISGPKLFFLFMDWAKEVGAKRVVVSKIVQNGSDKLDSFYTSRGLQKFETHYVKDL